MPSGAASVGLYVCPVGLPMRGQCAVCEAVSGLPVRGCMLSGAVPSRGLDVCQCEVAYPAVAVPDTGQCEARVVSVSQCEVVCPAGCQCQARQHEAVMPSGAASARLKSQE